VSQLEYSYDLTPGLTLDEEQIAAAGWEAGWHNTNALAAITAVGGPAGGQSGGSPGSIGVGNPAAGDSEYSMGLTQFNANAHKSLASQYGPIQLLTPIGNLSASGAISGFGQTFTPWETSAQVGESSAQIEQSYLARDPSALVAAEAVAAMPESERQQIAATAQENTLTKLGSSPSWPQPPDPSQIPAGFLTGPKATQSGEGPVNLLANPGAGGSLTSSPGYAPPSTSSGFLGILQRIDGVMNPSLGVNVSVEWWNPLSWIGAAGSAATQGVTDAVKLLGVAGIRLAFALPGAVLLVVGLGFSGGGIIADLLPEPLGSAVKAAGKAVK